MRVLLIKPPNRGLFHPRFKTRVTPIGLAYLSSVLRARGHEPYIFDSFAHESDSHVVDAEDFVDEVERVKLDRSPRLKHLIHYGATWGRIEAAIRDAKPDVIGISCMFSPYYVSAYHVAKIAKRVAPDVPVLFGGPHATVAYEHVLRKCPVDAVVLGEGEDLLPQVLDALAEGKPLADIAGVAVRCGEGRCTCEAASKERIHGTRNNAWIEDLDRIPLPAADQLDFEKYARTTTLITSRGCPFSCSFCAVHATVGKKFRARRVSAVVDEIEWYVRNHGITRFDIEDDNFTFDIARVEAICQEIVARSLKVDLYLPNGITVLKMTEHLVELMVRAGFRWLFLGLETTDPDKLAEIAKGFTSLGKVQEAVECFAKNGLRASASLVLALPGQSIQDCVRDAVQLWARGIQFFCNPFYAIPGTPDYARVVAQGLIDEHTDFALMEQMACFGNGIISSEQLYVLWCTLTALGIWPEVVREARRAAARGEPPSPGELATKLRQTIPCNCVDQALAPEPGRRHVGVCTLTGDLVAAAVSLACGSPMRAEERECRLDGVAGECTFDFVAEKAGALHDVVCAVGTALDEALEAPPPLPVKRKAARVRLPVGEA